MLLDLFFESDGDATLRLSVIDLLGNLCCDSGLCLVVIYALDERKPKYRYRHHSGAVYFLDLTDSERHNALRISHGGVGTQSLVERSRRQTQDPKARSLQLHESVRTGTGDQ
ncbi:hypothetical protein PINS_up018903 [Pythium insidiosum]|nr:hypothetical protein PINS_up018903 [Pythium insidiosum]